MNCLIDDGTACQEKDKYDGHQDLKDEVKE
jgi:hypothetical protein